MSSSDDTTVFPSEVIDNLLSGITDFPFVSGRSFLNTVVCQWCYVINLDTNVLEIYGIKNGLAGSSRIHGHYSKLSLISIFNLKMVEKGFEFWTEKIVEECDEATELDEEQKLLAPEGVEKMFLSADNIEEFDEQMQKALENGFTILGMSFNAHLFKRTNTDGQ
jgi:hypothetical protein